MSVTFLNALSAILCCPPLQLSFYVLLTHICALTVFSRHKYTYQFTSAAPISILLHDVVLHTEEMKQSAALYMTIVVYSS